MNIDEQASSGQKASMSWEGGGKKPASGILRTAASPRTYFGPTRGAI